MPPPVKGGWHRGEKADGYEDASAESEQMDSKQGSLPPALELLFSSASSRNGFLTEAAAPQTCENIPAVLCPHLQLRICKEASLAAPSTVQTSALGPLSPRVETCSLRAKGDEAVNTDADI